MKKNQGFSLVELIVVIAIMAVLVGVLAPAYLRYVEKSRKSSDVSSISDIIAAAEKVAVDVQFDLAAGTKFVLTVTNGTGACTFAVNPASGAATATETAALNEWKDIAGTYTCKSKEFKALTTDTVFTGTIQGNGTVTWVNTGNKTIQNYSVDFKSKWNLS